MTVTPELAGCLFKLDILSMRQIAADAHDFNSPKVVLLILRILKDLAPVCGHYGFEISIYDDDSYSSYTKMVMTHTNGMLQFSTNGLRAVRLTTCRSLHCWHLTLPRFRYLGLMILSLFFAPMKMNNITVITYNWVLVIRNICHM